jgi:hypothetical protein
MSVRQRVSASLAFLLIGGLLSLIPPLVSAARADDPQPGVSSDALAVLGRMSKTLLAKQFSFQSRTFRVYAGPNGEMLHIAHSTKTVVRRPDRLLVDVTGDNGQAKMIYDGKTLILYNVDQKKYTSSPAGGTIQEALDVAETQTGFDFPLADLLSSDPEKSVLAGVTSGGQVGTATIDGVRCSHFFFNQDPDMELELWLEDNDRALPRRVVVTYRAQPGHPDFIAELSAWDLSAQAPDSEFVFQPPAGVTQVQSPPKPGAAPGPAK